jgi:CheY-like chemotaxis protein
LSIVRRLAELHGGRVEATSSGVDRGSTFAVYLPAAEPGVPIEPRIGPERARPPLVATVESQPRDSHDPLVLVVEDDAHIATVLRTYLEADGYRVQTATDGQQAIDLARRAQPFAITLDISLPKLDGWAVLNALKREPLTSEIPVIIVSIVDNRDFGLVLGATDYLVKPIDPERLRGALRNLAQARGGTDGTILIVDDDPALRDVLSNSLAEDGWRVATAENGEAALAAVERDPPAAMVLDLMMPHVDGFEVLQRLRGRPATRDLPVIVVTAKELADEDRQRLSRSAERIVLKQALRVDELREEVRALLSAHRTRNGHGGGADRTRKESTA